MARRASKEVCDREARERALALVMWNLGEARAKREEALARRDFTGPQGVNHYDKLIEAARVRARALLDREA